MISRCQDLHLEVTWVYHRQTIFNSKKEFTVSQPVLSEINVFPVKSIASVRQHCANIEPEGLQFDRRYLITFPDGSMVTARKYPQLVKVHATLQPGGLLLQYPGRRPLILDTTTFAMTLTAAQVWKDQFQAYTTTEAASQWFSAIIGEPVQLLYLGETSLRVGGRAGVKVSFADGYPLLMISEASLQALNDRSPVTHSMKQFRANLVVSGSNAFEEDTWKRFRIGDVVFEAREPCSRCILTTVNPETGTLNADREPLSTLATFRMGANGKVHFGQNLVPLNEGVIHQGDSIKVLETRTPETYPDYRRQERLLTCVGKESIARDFCTLWLETQNHETLPPYLPGQHLPVSVTINGERHHRCYTLSSSPSRPGRYAISVKRVEKGQVSNWFHDHFSVGNTLTASSPGGAFHLREKAERYLLLSAGSGITPMLAMLRYLADHQQIDNVVFYHQCRTQDDIPCREELEKLQEQHAGLAVHIALTQADSEWRGICGRLHHQHLLYIPEWTTRQTFVCGPDGFMKLARGLLTRTGLPNHLYHQESFGISAKNADPGVKALTITINGNTFQGNNQDTLLEQAENAGFPLPYSCRAGFCSACKLHITTGTIHQPDVPAIGSDEVEQGFALACCCVPETDLEANN